MSAQIISTKGNLISIKRSLKLAKNGFQLLDKKRNILVREMILLIDRASEIQKKIDKAYTEAYFALQKANITLGICDELSNTVPEENGIKVLYRSVMGVEIPIVSISKNKQNKNVPFGLYSSNSMLDEAYIKFKQVKNLTVDLAEIENSVYRLANAIKKTKKRANALKNIMIPRFENSVKFITNALDEKDREEFSRLKVIKRHKIK